MSAREIVKLQERPELRDHAANWFHEKWGVPLEAYLDSMEECIKGENAVPRWYLAIAADQGADKIIGGLGVIDNDFHPRKDLTPNICALYVEESCRRQGIAGELLAFAREDMRRMGIDTLYLLTDHTSFYERYGWKFLCPVKGDGEEEASRMYVYPGI